MSFLYESARTGMRHFTEADLDAFSAIMAKPELHRFSYRGPLSRDETSQMIGRFQARYAKDGTGPYALILKEGEKLIGYCGLPVHEIDGSREVEVGYGLDPLFQGKGFATEATCATRDYAFGRLKLARVISIIREANVASIRVAEKMGMTLEKKSVFYGNPVLIYSVAKSPRLK